MLTQIVAWLCRFGNIRRLLWRKWYDFLAARYRASDWTFMNYGYVSLHHEAAIPLDPQDEPHRYCIQLYHFVASLADLRGKTVLEVGSGRGGGAAYVKRSFGAQAVTGLDFSANAVAFCQARHRAAGLSFQEGSAEALPFDDAAFDVILNVESSHCYGSMPDFLSEVHRVLRPGGFFLHADLRTKNGLDEWEAQLGASGLRMLQKFDIRQNVVAALDRDNDRKSAMIRKLIPRILRRSFNDFAGMRGSAIYEGFRTGRFVYQVFAMQKPFTGDHETSTSGVELPRGASR